jgi:hypothetical protein
MKYILFVLLYVLGFANADAQKPSCSCVNKQGVNGLSLGGTINYKGTSKSIGHTYEANLIFENQSKCMLKVEDVLIGSTLIKLNLAINFDAKNRKKVYKKIIQLNTLLEPSIGLDDALFADLLVSYTLNSTVCSNEVTVAYADLTKK